MAATTAIRLATPADHAFVVEANLTMAWETEQLRLDEATVREGVRNLLQSPDKGFYLIAEVDGVPAGQLMITSEWSDWWNGHYWWIQSVYVKPEFRKRKIFTKLFEHVEQLAQTRGDVRQIRLYVERQNTTAQATYKKMGMHHSHYDMYEKVLPLPGHPRQ